MSAILVLAKNTFREIIRDRILYGLVVFALILVGVSLALGQLSFSEQSRISANFGFTGAHISAILLSIFVGSTLVSKEIDKKTILTLLARPLTRVQFLLGKASGLLLVILTVISGLAGVMVAVFFGLGLDITPQFFVGLHGIFLESVLLLGLSMFFSSFSRPVMVVCFSIGIFLIGHWIENLHFFANKSESPAFISFARIVSVVFPDLEKFNWRSMFLYHDEIFLKDIFFASIYSFAWFGLLITLTALVLRRKDFG